MTTDVFDVFKSLSDRTRARLVGLLTAQGELCVRDLTKALALSQPKISRHLGYLRENGILAVRRSGTWIYYRVNPELSEWAAKVIKVFCETEYMSAQILQDQARLAGGASAAGQASEVTQTEVSESAQASSETSLAECIA